MSCCCTLVTEPLPTIQIDPSTFADDWLAALKDQRDTDVLFVLGSGTEIRAHKIVLCAASSFFADVICQTEVERCCQFWWSCLPLSRIEGTYIFLFSGVLILDCLTIVIVPHSWFIRQCGPMSLLPDTEKLRVAHAPGMRGGFPRHRGYRTRHASQHVRDAQPTILRIR